jgi:hypothetical protein
MNESDQRVVFDYTNGKIKNKGNKSQQILALLIMLAKFKFVAFQINMSLST